MIIRLSRETKILETFLNQAHFDLVSDKLPIIFFVRK
jgi:hypothetical protein